MREQKVPHKVDVQVALSLPHRGEIYAGDRTGLGQLCQIRRNCFLLPRRFTSIKSLKRLFCCIPRGRGNEFVSSYMRVQIFGTDGAKYDTAVVAQPREDVQEEIFSFCEEKCLSWEVLV